jgi:adenylate cyclase
MERRLAAILAADVVGYSRLMEQDEAGTMVALKARRKGVLEPLVARFEGRVFKVVGDGVLVEFGSAVKAMECAVELQQGMAAANSDLPEACHILLRIGLNLGDVMVEGGDLYGDGVNIAARLEALAEPGGICASAKLRDEIGRKLDLSFDDLGEQTLKNLASPVRVYRVRSGAEPPAVRPALADKPSIVVLPFTNMSGDPEQEYFSDGITEDIITDLSQVSALFVVARHTAFAFKGRPIQLPQAARELSVRYVLEGSVRRAEARVRITAQLIDGASGGHLWARRYDRDLTDIFALQDEIAASIVEALKVKLLPEERATIANRSTSDVEAYQYYLMGRPLLLNIGDKHALRSARRFFVKATEIDPRYARAHAGIADSDALLWVAGDIEISFNEILANSNKALALDPNLAEAHSSRGLAYFLSGRFDEATTAYERAIRLNPNLFEAHLFYADSCRGMGLYERAATLFERAAELKPDDYIALCVLASLYKTLGRPEEFVSTARRCLERARAEIAAHPTNALAISFGAVAWAYVGNNARAQEYADRAVVVDPEDYMVRYLVACVHALLGNVDAALASLERMVSGASRWQQWVLGVIQHDSDWDTLRGDARFAAFLKRLESELAAQT